MRLTITTALFLLSASCVHPIPVRAQTAVFPGTVVTNGQLKVMVNGMQTTLNGNLSSTATSIPVAACGTIPINSLVTIDQEIIGAANCSGNVITVATSAPGCTSGRGCDSTVPAGHVTGALVSMYFDAWHHNALRVEVEAIETALGANLANVVTSGNTVATLTIGTLTSTTSLVINSTVSGTHGQPFGTSDVPTFGGITTSGLTVNTSVANFADGIIITGGNLLVGTGGIVMGNGVAPTVTSGQIGLGSNVAASSSCGSLSGAAGCYSINVAGTARFIPYY